MEVTIRWLDEVGFEAQTGSGHRVVLDGAAQAGGANRGMRPMEAILVGLGTCSAFDVVTILKKARQQVTDCRVEVSATRADGIPRVFTRVQLHYVVEGHAIRESTVRRAIDLSAEKYCSATAMLRETVAIEHDYEIIQRENG